jgi:hypothetical protein
MILISEPYGDARGVMILTTSVVVKAHGSYVVTDAGRTEVRTSRPRPVEH